MNDMGKLVLASASERRAQLLGLVNIDFEIIPSSANEETDISTPREMVTELARRKAECVAKALPQRLVLGVDTIVCAQGRFLGKPADEEDAACMLKMLSGAWHSVYSGMCLARAGRIITACEETKVLFDIMSEEDIAHYISTRECFGKAGAYAIQGYAARYIKRIDGCYYNVMGLPLNRLMHMLNECNI